MSDQSETLRTGFLATKLINPLVTNGLSNPYHLDESISIFRDIRSIFFFIYILFFDEIHVSKQNSPSWDAAYCGVTSGAILFAYVPKKDARLIWVNNRLNSAGRQTYLPETNVVDGIHTP